MYICTYNTYIYIYNVFICRCVGVYVQICAKWGAPRLVLGSNPNPESLDPGHLLLAEGDLVLKRLAHHREAVFGGLLTGDARLFLGPVSDATSRCDPCCRLLLNTEHDVGTCSSCSIVRSSAASLSSGARGCRKNRAGDTQ